MQFWRRWRVLGMVALIGALASGSLRAAIAAEDLVKDAHDLETAKGASAIGIRMAILNPTKTMGMVDKDQYGTQMVGSPNSPGPFVKLLSSTNPDAQLNAAIVIAEAGTLSTDWSLEKMLKHPNPAVRYWGAQGLGNIMGPISSVGDGTKTRAISALTDALASEPSGLVKMQIIAALGKSGDLAPLLTGLDTLSKQLQNGPADATTLDAASTALTQFDTLIRAKGGLSKSDQTAVAKSAAWTASFAAQQQVAMKDKRDKEGSDMPDGYAGSVSNVVNNAVKVLNDLSSRGTFKVEPGDDSPAALQIAVDTLTGSASAGQGDLQKSMPDVPVPPTIK